MGSNSKPKKASKTLAKPKSKRKSSSLRKNITKKKLKVKHLDKEGIEIAEILRLSAAGPIRHEQSGSSALENKSLQRDWKNDKRIQERSQVEKQEMAEKLEKQIESISGFSL